MRIKLYRFPPSLCIFSIISTIILVPSVSFSSGYLTPTLGGIFSGPTSLNSASIYWNPGSLGFIRGTTFFGDFAFVYGSGTAQRLDPQEGDYGEPQAFSSLGPPIFAGATTDMGLDFMTIGFGVYTPYASGAFFKEQDGDYRYHMREGLTFTLYTTLAASVKPKKWFSLGAGVSYIFTDFYTLLSYDFLPFLIKTIDEEGEKLGIKYEHKWTDEDLESPDYESLIDLHHLKAHGFSFNAGIYLHPFPLLSLGLAYIHGMKIRSKGEVTITTPSIPIPQEDITDLIVDSYIENLGIRNSTFSGTGRVEFEYPPIITAGLSLHPSRRISLNLIFQYAFWSVFESYLISISETGQEFLDGDWEWAKDGKDTLSFGASYHHRISDKMKLGARLFYDSSAFPDETASPNAMDYASIETGVGTIYNISEKMGIGLEFNHYFLFERDISTSKLMESTTDPWSIPEEYSFPSANGIYRCNVERVGIIITYNF